MKSTIKVRYWKEIPVSVHASDDQNQRVNLPLPKIYMVTVDAVATRTGLTGSREYVAEFHNEVLESGEDAQTAGNRVLTELLQKFPGSWLKDQRRQAGIDAARESEIEQEARG